MAHNWWKILSAVLVIFTVIVGLRTPLSPGIPSAKPDKLNNGVTSVTIQGYNTHFTQAGRSLSIWVENGEATYCPYEIAVVSDTDIRATFSITDPVQNAFFDLYVSNPVDGTLYLPSAFLQNGLEVVDEPQKIEKCERERYEGMDMFNFPNQPILNETIRNLLFHVPSWFAMIFIMLVSLIRSIQYLNSGNLVRDMGAAASAEVGLVFAFIGLATGSIWARFTWGAWWVSDPRLNGAAITVLIYLAYFVLKSSVNDEEKAARLGAVYNIFAFVMMLVFIMILPRMTDSLHPGVGGNPAFSQYDLDDNMRMVFYPAVIGWIGVSLWIYQIRERIAKINFKRLLNDG